jgi:predicted PhzF superfamily epimerase YddE/YHI9
MSLDYQLLDVFTDTPLAGNQLAGNQLAVFAPSDGPRSASRSSGPLARAVVAR